jgi:hypothetical protein
MLSVAIYREPPARVVRTNPETSLADRQQAKLDQFMRRFVRSQRRQQLFRLEVLNRLGAGRPGDGAFEIALGQAALAIGIDADCIRRFGIVLEARGGNHTQQVPKDAKGLY